LRPSPVQGLRNTGSIFPRVLAAGHLRRLSRQ
jgi:hypothetical protein